MAMSPRLIAACLECDVEAVRAIVTDDPQTIFDKDERGDSALHVCARNPEAAACADSIVRAKPEAAMGANEGGQTPLHVAAAADNADLVRLVLAVTTRPLSAIDAEQHTALYTAVSKGSAAVCAELLEHTSNVQEADASGASLLHLACRVSGTKGQEAAGLEMIHLLLGRRAAVHATDSELRTPIMWATLMGNPKAVTLLIDRGADVGSRDRQGRSTIHCAASLGHVEIMRVLLDHRRSQLVNMADNNSCTPLLLAVGAGHMDVSKLLLSNGADPLRRDKNGRNAFHYAASGLHHKLFHALIEAGVNVWEAAFNGETVLHMVCGHERCEHENCLADGSESLSELLKRKRRRRDLDITNDLGETALIKAAKGGREDLCEILLKAGADPTIEINRGMLEPLTASDVATNDNCRELIQTYIERRAEFVDEEEEEKEDEEKANDDEEEGGEKQVATNEDEEKEKEEGKEEKGQSNAAEDREKEAENGEDKVMAEQEEKDEAKDGSLKGSQSPKISIVASSDEKLKETEKETNEETDTTVNDEVKVETINEEEKEEIKKKEEAGEEKVEKEERDTETEKVEGEMNEKKEEEKKDEENEKEEKKDDEANEVGLKKEENEKEEEDKERGSMTGEEKTGEVPKSEEKDEAKPENGVSAKKRKKKTKSEGQKATSNSLAGKSYPKGLLAPLRQVSVDEYYALYPPKPWFPPARKTDVKKEEANSKDTSGQLSNGRSRTLSKC